MNKRLILVIGLSIGLPLVLVGLIVVNWFVYPFTSADPNFADVEAVYNRMVVPDTWIKKGEGANKGIAGRQCPIESDGCFSKVATFTVPKTTTEEEIKEVYKSLGCVSVLSDRTEQRGGVTYIDFECSTEAVFPYGTLTEEGVDGWNLTLGVSSR